MGYSTEIARAYEKLLYPLVAEVTVTKARDDSGGFIISSTWTCGNPKEKIKLKITRQDFLSKSLEYVGSCGPHSASDIKRVCLSPSGTQRAVVRELLSASGKKCYLEIWSEKTRRLEATFTIAETKQHGAVYNDDRMGGMHFTVDEQQLVYVAERFKEESVPFISDSPSGKTGQKGAASIFVQSWGEQMSDMCESTLAVASVEAGTIEVIAPSVFEDTHLFPAEFVIAPENVIVGVVYETKPFKLGAKFCYNRRTRLYLLPLKFGPDGGFDSKNLKVDWVSGLENVNIWSLRLTPDGERVVFLSTQAGGTHQKTASLHVLTLRNKEVKTIVPVIKVWNRDTMFAGLYVELPKKCFIRSEDATTIVFHSPSLWASHVFAVDIDGKYVGVVRRLADGHTESSFGRGSWIVRCVDWDSQLVVASLSDSCTPSQLYVSHLRSESDSLEWKYIGNQELGRPPLLKDAQINRYFSFEEEDSGGDVLGANTLLILPGGAPQRSVPLVCFPHGGPHTVFLDEYTQDVAAFVACGFGVLRINYRGSLGCGEDYVQALPGKIGSLDVSDCHSTIMTVLERCDLLDPSKVVLFGGSHGGFLVLQLAGKYPDIYKCVVARNPVTYLPGKIGISDIPDWLYAEASWSYTHDALQISPEQYKTLSAMSPLAHIETLRCPVLFQVGKNDMRVPPSQSYMLHYALKARDVETTLRQYDDNHSLDKPEIHPEMLISSILWFRKHLGGE